MRINRHILAPAVAAFLVLVAHVAAQGPPPAQTPLGPPAGPAGRGRAATFPAQQRKPADPAIIARGKTLYEINCRACHGADLRGGDIGGPNLLRSPIVLADQHGEAILPVVRNGRQNPGMPVMPALPLPDDDVKAVAEYIHSVASTMRGQGAPPPGQEVELNILVGDAAAGQAYFKSKCSVCHSATGDLKGIAARVSSPVQLQNLWVSGGGGGGRGGRGRGAAGAGPAGAPGVARAISVTVTVTPPSGQPIEGRLNRIDDFLVTLTTADGSQRTFRRDGAVPKVEIRDPLQGHRDLLTGYTDKDIHDVTAYLVTLK